jgi:hypothetical protein
MNRNKVLSIIAKDKNELIESGQYLLDCQIKYEGLLDLKNKAKDFKRNLKGIAVTCNLANGGSFLDAIVTFNDNLKELKKVGYPLNIDPISHVYVLYRAINDSKLDQNFNEAGLICYRYFDLTEDLKKNLYDQNMTIEDFPCYQCINQKTRKPKCKAMHCYRHN